MGVQRNAPCPCGSGKKLKWCCLNDHLAWQRAGNGIVANYVAFEDGGRCLVSEWRGAIDASTILISELNPVTSAWVRNTLPDVACFGAPAYLEQMLEHLEAMSGGSLPLDVAVAVARELVAARSYLTYELARPTPSARTPA